MKIHRRYHITPFLEEENQYLKIDSTDDPFPDYFEKDLENFEKQTESIVQKLKRYALTLDALEIKIKKRERLGQLSLPEIHQIYQSFSKAVRRLDDLNTLINEMEKQLNKLS